MTFRHWCRCFRCSGPLVAYTLLCVVGLQVSRSCHDVATVPATMFSGLSTAFSFSGWFKTTVAPSAGTSRVLVSQWRQFTNPACFFALSVGDTGALRLRLSPDGTYANQYTAHTSPAGVFTHLFAWVSPVRLCGNALLSLC